MSYEQKFSKFFRAPKSEAEGEEELREYDHLKELVSSLPCEDGMRLYGGCWFPAVRLPGLLSAQKHFEACPATDVFLNTFPKSGTTWIRALAFAIVNRGTVPHPLLTTHPQDCAILLEGLYSARPVLLPDLTLNDGDRNHPRLFSSHAPFWMLPVSVKTSCKIVYVSRDPKDVVVSMLHFSNDIRPPGTPAYTVHDVVGRFCSGRFPFGPMWEHQMEYRRESLRRPEMVLFLEYEEMKAKPEESVRRLAEFLGMPFTEEEEKKGVVDEIVRMCSIEFLKGLDVNKAGVYLKERWVTIKNSSYFRKGTVGDWKEHLTPEMAHMIDSLVLSKTQSA